MPAKTKKQQRFFQLVRAIQEGKAEGSAKAREVAESMDPESVGHYTKLEKASSQNAEQLLRYAGLSALLGVAGAGTYGLSRYIHDKYMLPDEIEQIRKEMNAAKGVKKDVGSSANNPEMLSDESSDPSSISEEDKQLMAGKEAAFSFSDLWDTKELGNSAAYGLLTPLALFAPALLSYHFTKKYIDRNRNKRISDEVEEAKTEFEQVLSEKSSSLQQEIDSLLPMMKSAGIFSAPSWTPDFLDWTNRGPTAEQEVNLPIIGGPARQTNPDGSTEVAHRPGADPMGLLWIGGATAGLAGLGGYLLLKKKLEDDAELKKVKALKGLLKKDLAEAALQSGVQVSEDPSGNKRIDI